MPTSVQQIQADDGAVMYYDLLGHHGRVPLNGFNIVVIREGTQTRIVKTVIHNPVVY